MGSGHTQKGRPAYPGNTREGWYGEGMAGGDGFGPAKLGRGGEDVVDAGVGYGPPRFDSAGGDGEGDAAEELVPVDLHGAAPIVGGELGKHGGDGESSEGRGNVAS